jgi:hypothetical protein
MAHLQIDNLDDQPISFDLTDEDIESIKGGTAVVDDGDVSKKRPFPTKATDIKCKDIRVCSIRIYRIPIFIIKIQAYLDDNKFISELS